MVDSIVFRIKDLNANDNLLQYLFKEGLEGIESTTVAVGGDSYYRHEFNYDTSRWCVYRGSTDYVIRDYATEKEAQDLLVELKDGSKYKIEKEVTFRQYYKDNDSGKEWSRGYNGHLKSYHYDVAYYINFERDYVEFNFSIPKYLFGNNLMQAVPHHFDKYFGDYKTKYYYQLNWYHWNFFRKAFNHFLDTELGEVCPPKTEIEVVQLDLCFNLFFQEIKDMNFYMSYLRSVKKKYYRDGSDHAANWENSMHFKGSYHTLKLYNKGKEFKSGKAAGVKKKSNYREVRKRFGVEAADKIYNIGLKVLRMEVSFKKRGFSYYYMQYFAPAYYRLCVKIYRNYQKNGSFVYEGVQYKIGDRVSKDIKQILKDGKRLTSRLCSFYLALRPGDNEERFDFLCEFNQDLFYHLCKRFKEITSQYHVGKYKEFESLKYLLNYRNLQNGGIKKYNLSEKVVKVLTELLRTKSWSQIREAGYYGRNTLYRYKKFFDEVGMGEISTDMPQSAVDYTFDRYYDEIIPNIGLISRRTDLPFDL